MTERRSKDLLQRETHGKEEKNEWEVHHRPVPSWSKGAIQGPKATKFLFFREPHRDLAVFKMAEIK